MGADLRPENSPHPQTSRPAVGLAMPAATPVLQSSLMEPRVDGDAKPSQTVPCSLDLGLPRGAAREEATSQPRSGSLPPRLSSRNGSAAQLDELCREFRLQVRDMVAAGPPIN